jgi:hypothetical protein
MFYCMPILSCIKKLMTDIIELDYFFKRHLLDNVVHSILKLRIILIVLTYCILNFMELMIQLVAAVNLHI